MKTRYFQIQYRNAEGKSTLTSSIVTTHIPDGRPVTLKDLEGSLCLTYFVRKNFIAIWEVAS